MKKLFLFAGIFMMTLLNAQDITDAVRYGQQELLGTARYRGMSGAFGALGGDLSAIQINPAGSAVFLNSFASVTLSSTTTDTDVNYFSSISSNDSKNINFNQLGAVFIYNRGTESKGINKVSFGLAYDQTADNRGFFNASGRSNISIDRFFLEKAQGIPLNLIRVNNGETVNGVYSSLGENENYATQQAFLAQRSFLIVANQPENPENTSYSSNIASGNFDQDYLYGSSGINGKLTLNGGLQFNENFYVGANINSHFINYERTTDFFERNLNRGSINKVNFVNNLSTTGGGISAQIGGIAKVSNIFRFGLSLETPTLYIIQEETIQLLETISNANGRELVNPDIINIFPEYELTTPGKITGSMAVLFGNSGLISLDYSYKDYSKTEFSSDQNIDFSAKNKEIKDNLQATGSIRIGGEYRMGKWSYRAGYRFEQSPYKNDYIFSDIKGISLGFGYNFGKIKFDLAYDTSYQDKNQELYSNSAFNNTASIDNYTRNLTFTLGVNL